MDPGRAPERIFSAHTADQLAELAIDPEPSATPPGLPAPVRAEAASMPAQHSLRLDDDYGIQQRREEPRQPNENQAIDVSQSGALWRLAAQNQHLLAQDEDLGLTRAASSKHRQQRAQNPSQQTKHCAFDYHTCRASSRG